MTKSGMYESYMDLARGFIVAFGVGLVLWIVIAVLILYL